MIIDYILDRKDGEQYNAREFYNYVMGWNGLGDNIARAMDGGTNKDVQRELCAYIDAQGYNPEIKEYVNSVEWIEEEQHTTTLKECAEAFENDGKPVKIGNFSTFADFLSYFNYHYRPVLEKIAEGYTVIQEDARLLRLLRFFADDMLNAFKED